MAFCFMVYISHIAIQHVHNGGLCTKEASEKASILGMRIQLIDTNVLKPYSTSPRCPREHDHDRNCTPDTSPVAYFLPPRVNEKRD